MGLQGSVGLHGLKATACVPGSGFQFQWNGAVDDLEA